MNCVALLRSIVCLQIHSLTRARTRTRICTGGHHTTHQRKSITSAHYEKGCQLFIIIILIILVQVKMQEFYCCVVCVCALQWLWHWKSQWHLLHNVDTHTMPISFLWPFWELDIYLSFRFILDAFPQICNLSRHHSQVAFNSLHWTRPHMGSDAAQTFSTWNSDMNEFWHTYERLNAGISQHTMTQKCGLRSLYSLALFLSPPSWETLHVHATLVVGVSCISLSRLMSNHIFSF